MSSEDRRVLAVVGFVVLCCCPLRALALSAPPLGNAASLFVVLRGICDFLTVAGDLDGAEEMARRCLAIGEQTGLPEHLIDSNATVGYILFARGDLLSARRHFEYSARLYAEHDGARLPVVATHDPLVGALASLLQVLHAMGDEAGAKRVATELVVHARSLATRPFDLVYGLSWLAFYRLFRGDFAEMLTAALDEQTRDHQLAQQTKAG